MVSEFKNKEDKLENILSINFNIMLICKISNVKIEICINNFVIISRIYSYFWRVTIFQS